MDGKSCMPHLRKARLLATAMTIGIGASSLVSCSVASLFNEELVKVNAAVVMNDSVKYSGKTLLPDLKNSTLRFTTSDGKRLRLCSDSVAVLAFSRSGAMVGAFIYAPYKDRGRRDQGRAWMKCLGMGRHLKLAVVGMSWHFNRQGEIVPVSFVDGDAYIIGIKEDGVGEYLTTYGRAKAGIARVLCKYLADDPDLCEKIATKEIDAYDFAEICRMYSPKAQNDSDGINIRMAWNGKTAWRAEKGDRI